VFDHAAAPRFGVRQALLSSSTAAALLLREAKLPAGVMPVAFPLARGLPGWAGQDGAIGTQGKGLGTENCQRNARRGRHEYLDVQFLLQLTQHFAAITGPVDR